MSRSQIEARFPRLRRTPYGITSPQAPSYNCIAWAAGEDGRRLWPAGAPDYYWPPNLPNGLQVDSFVALFESLGYEECAGGELEAGFEKVALFARENGEPTHAARQLENGRWTSKLGNLEDIQHSLYGLEGGFYGDAVRFLKRPRT